MKTDKEILRELKEHQQKLSILNSEINTANELKSVISKISHFCYINDVDKDLRDSVINRFDNEISWIKDHVKYGVNAPTTKAKFRKTQDECLFILRHAINNIEAKLQSGHSAKE